MNLGDLAEKEWKIRPDIRVDPAAGYAEFGDKNVERPSRDARILRKPFSRAIFLEEVCELGTAASSKRRDGWNGKARPAATFLSLSGKESPE